MKKFSFSYVVIPLVVIGVALLGQHFTASGMERYATLRLPSLTPPGWIIGMIRTFIFALGTFSAVRFRHASEHDKKFGLAISMFIDNAVLNILRSRLFFVKHLFVRSIVDMILLLVVTVMLIIATYPRSKRSAYALIPYALWLIIATVFAIRIYFLN